MLNQIMKNRNKITYSQVGDNYETKDPVKKIIQSSAAKTSINLQKKIFEEISDSRGESAFVWSQGNILMASVIEGLGTKNLIADEMSKISHKTYYDIIGHDTVATIINDLVTVGAKPLVVHAYWAIEDNSWLKNKKRIKDLVRGWKSACDLSGVAWGGGETPTLKQIMMPNTCELAGSAVGIISPKDNLITDKNLQSGDRILFTKSSGVNANGISLTRAIAKKLPKGYASKLPNGKMYGESLLTKTNIYAKLVEDLLKNKISIHYISNITGHGLRKIMRARRDFTYVIEKIFNPQEIFSFIQKHANLDDKEMYATYNMGMDYALFIPEKDIEKAQKIVKQNKFQSINAGFIKKGSRRVIIKPKNIVFEASSLDLR
jgi:phosphoribosylformylglycinamidine cyclo-ligase